MLLKRLSVLLKVLPIAARDILYCTIELPKCQAALQVPKHNCDVRQLTVCVLR